VTSSAIPKSKVSGQVHLLLNYAKLNHKPKKDDSV
jgi:hypothetical protein